MIFIQYGNEPERKALATGIEKSGQEHGLEIHCVRPLMTNKAYVLDEEKCDA